MEEPSFFGRNKIVSFSIIIACLLFIGIFFMEKSKSIINMIPVLRGEVSIGNGFIITTTKTGYPILVKKDDPAIGNQLRFSGDVRSDFDDVVFSLCNGNGTIIELGANFGYRTLHLCKLVGKDGKVFAFEPNSGVFSKLRKTIFLNDFENIVTLKNMAISDYKGTCNIDDCLSIKKKENGELTKPRKIVVNCNTLDNEMLDELVFIDLLSIDIPGNEIAILSGASNIIRNSPDITIVVSFDNFPVNPHAKTEFKKLEKDKFNFYVLDAEKKLKKMSLQKVLEQKEVILVITRKKQIF